VYAPHQIITNQTNALNSLHNHPGITTNLHTTLNLNFIITGEAAP